MFYVNVYIRFPIYICIHYSTINIYLEYSLTENGRELVSILQDLHKWGQAQLDNNR
ncbi:winged helix-turn-helix transcriptional regulator [Inconstantimicrobium porci]|uniref:winged helix-turn-helix transcriptional regulator n=1 Tax=Inconstantimicrobium porci TaxID=2652291 RepID=UPI00389AACE9